ncbi:MAG: hypothetical protein AB7I25_10775 [Vicinamibacterales bacterium]
MATMTDQELRSLVRQVIDQHLPPAAPSPALSHGDLRHAPGPHASHLMLVVAESDGPCIIEPAVPCNHCGYCKSLGH